MQRSSKAILSVAGLLLIVLAVMKLAAPSSLSDTVQITNQLTDAAQAADDKDVPGVMRIVSQNYQDSNGNNPIQLSLLMRRGFQNVQNVTVTRSTIKVTVSGNDAETTCYFDIAADNNTYFNEPVTLEWKKEATHRYLIFPDQVWRVTRATFAGAIPDGD